MISTLSSLATRKRRGGRVRLPPSGFRDDYSSARNGRPCATTIHHVVICSSLCARAAFVGGMSEAADDLRHLMGDGGAASIRGVVAAASISAAILSGCHRRIADDFGLGHLSGRLALPAVQRLFPLSFQPRRLLSAVVRSLWPCALHADLFRLLPSMWLRSARQCLGPMPRMRPGDGKREKPVRSRRPDALSSPARLGAHYKKNFRVPRMARDRLQLFAAARVRRISPQFVFGRPKKSLDFVFKADF